MNEPTIDNPTITLRTDWHPVGPHAWEAELPGGVILRVEKNESRYASRSWRWVLRSDDRFVSGYAPSRTEAMIAALDAAGVGPGAVVR